MKDISFFGGNEILKVVKIEDLNGDYPKWLKDNFSFDKPYIDEYIRVVRDIYAFVLINVKGDKMVDKLTKSQYEQIFGSEDKPKQSIKKVNVLGTEYEVELLDEQDETMKVMNCDGYTDNSIKSIKVFKNKNDDVTKQQNPIKHQNIVLRHELIHAFLYECGIDLGMQFHNEECVDFFAMQFNKLSKIFEDAGCLDDGKDLDSFKETLKKYHRVE